MHYFHFHSHVESLEKFSSSASEEGGYVALSQMATFLAVEQKNFYGDIVTLCLVTCENVGTLVTTRDEKTAPPIIAE